MPAATGLPASPSISAASSGSPITIGDSISQLASDGTVISTGYSDNMASISHPQGIAIDGSGHVWVTNILGSSITELAGSAANSPGQILSPTAGWARDAGLNEGYAVAIDASGNLWVTNYDHQHPDRNRRTGDPRQDSPAWSGPDALEPSRLGRVPEAFTSPNSIRRP